MYGGDDLTLTGGWEHPGLPDTQAKRLRQLAVQLAAYCTPVTRRFVGAEGAPLLISVA